MADDTDNGRHRGADREQGEHGGVGDSDQPKDDRQNPDADDYLPTKTKAWWNFGTHRVEQLGDLDLRVEQVGIHPV